MCCLQNLVEFEKGLKGRLLLSQMQGPGRNVEDNVRMLDEANARKKNMEDMCDDIGRELERVDEAIGVWKSRGEFRRKGGDDIDDAFLAAAAAVDVLWADMMILVRGHVFATS